MKNHYFSSLLPIACCLLLATACKDTKELPACTDVHWDYDDSHEEGPSHWADLCVDYTPCGGVAQSPVDIAGGTDDASLSALSKHFEPSGTHIVNNGHTIQFNTDAGTTLTLNGQTYQLLQFHFHTSSEHTVGGTSYPMEVHFVHKNETTGALAVVGVLFEERAENGFLQPVIDHLPASKDATFDDAALTFSVSDLMPADQNYYTYSGSLTTPPCSEIVTWLVMEEPIEASHEQIEAIHDLEHSNNRPVQSLNGRALRRFND